MRIRDEFFNQRVTALWVHAGDAVAERVFFNALQLTVKVAPLFMEKRGAVSDEELRVAYLGTVNGRKVNLGQNSLGQGEPYPAGHGIGRANSVFGADGPGRCNTRVAKGAFDSCRGITCHGSYLSIHCTGKTTNANAQR